MMWANPEGEAVMNCSFPVELREIETFSLRYMSRLRNSREKLEPKSTWALLWDFPEEDLSEWRREVFLCSRRTLFELGSFGRRFLVARTICKEVTTSTWVVGPFWSRLAYASITPCKRASHLPEWQPPWWMQRKKVKKQSQNESQKQNIPSMSWSRVAEKKTLSNCRVGSFRGEFL